MPEEVPMSEPKKSVPALRVDRRRRSVRLSALFAVLAALVLSALPGTASATTTTTTPKVTPILDCYAQNSDGSWTVVLGYSSTYTGTKSIARGVNNYTNPASYGPQMPTQFKRGTYHGVVTVKVSQADMWANPYWYLDGTTLDYRAAAYASGICTPSQLPALANGAVLVGGLVFAGVIGVVVVRRVRRTATGSAAVRGEPAPSGAERA
jgi:hypothetical protein